jgi:hypothetical protein
MSDKNKCIKVFTLLVIILVTVPSCKKFVTIAPPVNDPVSAVIFTDDAMAVSAVAGIYSDMMSISAQFSSAGVTIYTGMYADELTYSVIGTPRDEFIKNDLTEINHTTLLSNFWEKTYKFIYTANVCIEGLNKSTKISSQLKNMLTGECKFIRAFCYFHLVNLFGDVPLSISSDYKINSTLPRSLVKDVYARIISDLQEAQNLLGTEYPTPGRVRPNKWAATALLARVYLYQKDWKNAEIQSDLVINADSPLFDLVSNLNDVFLSTSKEAIWQLLPVSPTVNATWEGNLFIPPNNFSAIYKLTPSLLNSFEVNDQRKISWIKSRPTTTGGTDYYPYKYKIRSAAAVSENYMVLRLSEQYLIRAEARIWLNKLPEAVADINAIRSRAGLADIPLGTQAELIAAIEQERRVELFAEWGHRWYDLKRTDRADAVLGNLKPAWQLTDVLWPVPSSQIKANPALIQNPGY